MKKCQVNAGVEIMTGSWYNSISLFPIVQADPPQLRYLAGGSSFSGTESEGVIVDLMAMNTEKTIRSYAKIYRKALVGGKIKEHTTYALEIMLCCFSEAARSFRRGPVLRSKTR